MPAASSASTIPRANGSSGTTATRSTSSFFRESHHARYIRSPHVMAFRNLRDSAVPRRAVQSINLFALGELYGYRMFPAPAAHDEYIHLYFSSVFIPRLVYIGTCSLMRVAAYRHLWWADGPLPADGLWKADTHLPAGSRISMSCLPASPFCHLYSPFVPPFRVSMNSIYLISAYLTHRPSLVPVGPHSGVYVLDR